jgi:hypothetical protein
LNVLYGVALGLFAIAGAAMTIGLRHAGYGFVCLGGLVVLTVHALERRSDPKKEQSLPACQNPVLADGR